MVSLKFSRLIEITNLQIIDGFHISGTACKNRWANIRDNFRKSLQKQKTKSGQQAKNVKRYKYSEQLEFILKYVKDRQTVTNIGGEENNQQLSEAELRETEDDLDENLQGAEIATGNSEIPIQDKNKSTPMASKAIPRKKIKLPQDNPPKTAAATLMEYVIKRNEGLANQPQQQNPVDAFLAGLAPALKTLPPQQWIQAKGELFNVVQKYEMQLLNMDQQHGYPASHLSPSPSAQSSRSGSWQQDVDQPQPTTLSTETPVFGNALQQYFEQYS